MLKHETVEAVLASPELLEALALAVHASWAGWAAWMLAKYNDTHANGERFPDRWRRQIASAYAELSEQEKESDREEARALIEVVRRAFELEGVSVAH